MKDCFHPWKNIYYQKIMIELFIYHYMKVLECLQPKTFISCKAGDCIYYLRLVTVMLVFACFFIFPSFSCIYFSHSAFSSYYTGWFHKLLQNLRDVFPKFTKIHVSGATWSCFFFTASSLWNIIISEINNYIINVYYLWKSYSAILSSAWVNVSVILLKS